jgi:hypothetical protein
LAALTVTITVVCLVELKADQMVDRKDGWKARCSAALKAKLWAVNLVDMRAVPTADPKVHGMDRVMVDLTDVKMVD